MSTRTRIASFTVVLGAVFAAAFLVGSAFDPADTDAGGGHADAGHAATGGGAEHAGAAHDQAGHGATGYALRLDQAQLRRGESQELSFRIEGADGAPLRRFDELHERRMHLILVRRDGTGFQHLHPELAADGTWTVQVEVAAAGAYRAFADFSVGGEQHTLAADLVVPGGDFTVRPFPAPVALAEVEGYEVRLAAGAPRPGREARLVFAVSRDGEEVDDLQPYLGAKGHLVALREGDLAYLHVHPEEGGHEHGGEPAAAHPGEIPFAATFPTAGRYRLYLQFRHEGAVRTAAFTVEVPR
jgi:hypothetical protein